MKKFWKILLIVISVLVIIRIILPYVIKWQANKAINKSESFAGSIEDVDLFLIRGYYTIEEVYLIQIKEETEDTITPFLKIDTINISIQWDPLFKGKVVGKLELINPVINYVVIREKKPEKEVDIVQVIKDIIPFRINELNLKNANISYYDFTIDPDLNASLSNFDLTARNLSNIENPTDTLPASLVANGTTIGNGIISLSAEMNLLEKKIPDMDLNLALQDVQLSVLNDFARSYGNFDFEKGTFSFFTEFVIENSQIEGYIKPVFEDVEILENEKEDFAGKIWEAVLGGIVNLFSNPKKDRLATQVPVEQNLEDIDVGIITGIWNLLKNAFVEALNKELNYSLEYPVENESNN